MLLTARFINNQAHLAIALQMSTVDTVTVKNDNTLLYRFKDGSEILLPIPDRK